MIRCPGGKARYSAGTNSPGFASYLYHAKLCTTACTTLDAKKKKKKNCAQAPLSETINFKRVLLQKEFAAPGTT